MVVSAPWGGNIEDFAEYGPTFYMLTSTAASLSIIGSMMVIIVFLVFVQLRRFFARLVVYLALSDLWMCASFLLGQSRAPHYTRCMVQASLSSFFGLSSILWTVVIADSLRRLLLAQDLAVESKYEARVHIFAWGASTLSLLLGLCTGVFGPAGMTCWIRNTALGTIVRMLTFYLPLWASIGYCSWVYWYVRALMRQLRIRQSVDANPDTESSVFEYQKEVEKQHRSLQCLLLLPLILVVCWTPATIRRLIDIFSPNLRLSLAPLDYLCVFMGPLQGFLNAIVYGATPAVRDAMTGRLDKSAFVLFRVQQRLGSVKLIGKRRFGRFKDKGGSSMQNGHSAGVSLPETRPAGSLGSIQPAVLGHTLDPRYHGDQLLDDLDEPWEKPDHETERGSGAVNRSIDFNREVSNASSTSSVASPTALRHAGDGRGHGDPPPTLESSPPPSPPPSDLPDLLEQAGEGNSNSRA